MPSRYPLALGLSFTLHILAVLAMVWRPGATVSRLEGPPGKTITVFTVAPEDATYAGLNPVSRPATADEALTRPIGGESSMLQVGDVRIDVERIRERGQVLFPFLTPGLSLDHFLPGPVHDVLARLENPLAAERRRREQREFRGPLVMGEAELQSMVDKTWSRHDRWIAFEPIAKIAPQYDADAGQLPALLQRYRDQNALQPYADTTIRDPRLWAQLGIAADHVTFISFIRRYASAHPSTRATTELLLLLDRIAEANQDALSVLRANDPSTDLAWTRRANPEAYDLVVGIRRYYQREANRQGLFTDEAVDRFYEQARLAILEGIVRATPGGYRQSDAHFRIGVIYWTQHKPEEAVRAWRRMAPEPGDSHAIAGTQILEALQSGRPLAREIDRILKNDHGRWLSFSDQRLRRFGYRFDSF
jgi:hypothetical protein